MTLEILLSSIAEQEKNAYLQKTISALSDEEKKGVLYYGLKHCERRRSSVDFFCRNPVRLVERFPEKLRKILASIFVRAFYPTRVLKHILLGLAIPKMRKTVLK